MKSAFDDLFGVMIKVALQGLDAADSQELPLKSYAIASFVSSLCRQSRNAIAGNDREFMDFAMFAFLNSCASYSEGGQDLMAAYILGEMSDGIFVEIGNGIPHIGSNTALLEARYGWSGVLFDSCPANLESLRRCRQADIRPLDFHERISSINVEGANVDSNIGDHYVPLLLRGISPEVQQNIVTLSVNFLSISHPKHLEVLESLDFSIEQIDVIHILHDWKDQKRLVSFFDGLGFEAWLPEFTGSSFILVSAKLKRTRRHFFEWTQREAVSSLIRNKRISNRLEMLSIHLPKTGGASLIEGLKSHYGEAYYEDWLHIPSHPLHNCRLPLTVGRGVKAVHGHLRLESYIGLNPEFICTFIRDPVHQVISLYYYWQTLDPCDDHEHSVFLVEGPSIFDFAKKCKGYYAYFAGTDMSRFDFVGRFEIYNDEMTRLGHLTGIPFSPVHLNKTPPAEERDELISSPKKMSELKDVLRDEYVIYDRMLKYCR